MLDRLETSRAALDESVRAQRQLVADASHELRTPVTSLRTNIEVLLGRGRARRGGPPPAAGRRGRAERGAERTRRRPDRPRPRRPAGRVDRRRPARPDRRGVGGPLATQLARTSTSTPSLDPVIVEGVPERLERAINNLLDNAARHSPPGGTVEIRVDREGVRGPRPRHRRRRGRTSRTSSTASSAARTRAGSRAAAWGWRSCARSPSSTAARSPPRTPPTAARSSPCGCRPCPPSPPRFRGPCGMARPRSRPELRPRAISATERPKAARPRRRLPSVTGPKRRRSTRHRGPPSILAFA